VPLREQLRDERHRRSDLWNLEPQLPSAVCKSPGPESVALPRRTLGPTLIDDARFDEGQHSKAGRALLPDLLLSAAGKPVLGEVKIGADEPFVAIVQLMTYIAHLVTPDTICPPNRKLPERGLRSGLRVMLAIAWAMVPTLSAERVEAL
jgi:hypothetical protein